jgi:hypothetical protein
MSTTKKSTSNNHSLPGEPSKGLCVLHPSRQQLQRIKSFGMKAQKHDPTELFLKNAAPASTPQTEKGVHITIEGKSVALPFLSTLPP